MGARADGARNSWPTRTFLGRLSPASRARLFALGTPRSYVAGEPILVDGARDDRAVLLLVSGFAKVSIAVDHGLEALLAIRSRGDVVGEMAAITGQPRTATVTACGEISACALTHTAFTRALSEHPDLVGHLTAIQSERLRWANQQRSEFSAFPVPVRLARVLLHVARACGHPPTAAPVQLDVPLSQPELATMVGAAETTVHKALGDLRRRGILRTSYRSLTIKDPAALSAVAGSPESTQ